MNAFGGELRTARLEREWSRQKVAEESGLTVEDIEALENRHPDYGRAEVLAALQLDEVYLLTPPVATAFLDIAEPLTKRIDKDQLQMVLAEMLVVLGRAPDNGSNPGCDQPLWSRREKGRSRTSETASYLRRADRI